MEINNIIEGWSKLLLSKVGMLNRRSINLGIERIKICRNCPIRTEDKCDKTKEAKVEKDFYYKSRKENRKQGEEYKGCGCDIEAKVLCIPCQCPLGKW